MNTIPTISIVICTYNRAPHLRETLLSLAKVRVPDDCAVEVLVVDNGSTDDTAIVAQSCRLPQMTLHSLPEARQGQCYARNTGMAAARGRVIVFTDDDLRFPLNWLEGMVAPILSKKADAVAGGIVIAPHLQRSWMTPMHRMLLASTEGAETLVAMIGANMAFSRDVLTKVPSFNTDLGPGRLGVCDDTLFSLQVETAGYRLVSALDVVVEHWFDEARLQRSSFLSTAQKLGQSLAYLTYHWNHDLCELETSAFPEGKIMAPRRLLLKRRLQRLLRWGALERPSEAGTEWELRKTEQIAFYSQYLREQKRPRLYEKNGLIIKSGVTVQEGSR